MIRVTGPHSVARKEQKQLEVRFRVRPLVSQMKYSIKAHPTKYAGVQFRSRLEARWAAFFDLAAWKWDYEPIDFEGWSPDFRVEFPCKHSECRPSHVLFVEVKPYYSIEEFRGHPCLDYPYGGIAEVDGEFTFLIPADASAAFGATPETTYWCMGHGCGGGDEEILNWVDDTTMKWRQAGNIVQWHVRG